MERDLKLLEMTEDVVIGGTSAAVGEALRLASAGRKVTLLVRETYLATELCSAGRYGRIPDEQKLLPEERCRKAGISLYYGVTVITCEEDEEGWDVCLAAKGGCFRVRCRSVSVWDYGEADAGKDCYTALAKRESSENFRVLEAGFVWRRELSTAENLFAARTALIERYMEEKKIRPSLRLGRMAPKSCGMCGCGRQEVFSAEKESPEHWDVVVAGGGTAGAMAALYAARGGARTVLIEPQYDLGGTGTVGGVSTYWFGLRFREVEEIDREIGRLHRELKLARRQGIWSDSDDSHPGIRGYVLLKLCLEAGVEVRFGQTGYGVVSENGRICGIRTAGDGGRYRYLGKILIDATGDADLAVSAGAACVYGSKANGITYWASLAQYTDIDSYRNNFSSMVRLDDPADFTRFVLLGRRRGEHTFDHGIYVSPRESRRIVGSKVIDLRDICCLRTYEDGLYTCYSNYDPKGKLDADMVYCGFLPPQVRIQIPLSALLPVNADGERLRGLYVAGKAISSTHNAFPSIRMQTDLMHQGAVLGILASYAVKNGMDIEEIDGRKRRALVREGTGDDLRLPVNPYEEGAKDREPGDCVGDISGTSRTHWVDVPFQEEVQSMSPVLAAVCMEDGKILPALKTRIRELEGDARDAGNGRDREAERRLLGLLKRLALWHGCDDYTGELVEEITAKICLAGDSDGPGAERGLPGREGSVMCAQLLPDHGVMPEVVYDLNLLSNSRVKFSMEPFRLVCERLKSGPRDYRDIRKGIFCYMESVAYVGRKTGRPEFIPLLKTIGNFPELTKAAEGGQEADLLTERLQILYGEIFHALEVLGDPEGALGLGRLLHAGSSSVRQMAAKYLKHNTEENANVRRW